MNSLHSNRLSLFVVLWKTNMCIKIVTMTHEGIERCGSWSCCTKQQVNPIDILLIRGALSFFAIRFAFLMNFKPFFVLSASSSSSCNIPIEVRNENRMQVNREKTTAFGVQILKCEWWCIGMLEEYQIDQDEIYARIVHSLLPLFQDNPWRIWFIFKAKMEEQLMSEDEKDYANTFRTMTSMENETEEAFPAHKKEVFHRLRHRSISEHWWCWLLMPGFIEWIGVDGIYQYAILLNVHNTPMTRRISMKTNADRRHHTEFRLVDLELQYPNWTAKILY